MSKRPQRSTFSGRQAFPLKSWRCGCEADQTWETTTIESRRGNPWQYKRAKMIFHVRQRDGARFWHWSDVSPVAPPHPGE